jgi:gamma-glutamyltranspeptidase / glutathione hydrolase
MATSPRSRRASTASTGAARLPAPTETGILFKDGKPVLGFASMGSGLHQRTFQALVNVMHFGMTVDEAINTPDFLLPDTDLTTGEITFRVPKGRFSKAVLDAVGYRYREVDPRDVRLGGEGLVDRHTHLHGLRWASMWPCTLDANS